MGKRSLNKTFRVLIAFALIERDEIEDIPSASSPDTTRTSASSADPLDVLKVHGIVQSFFIETLKKERQLQFWLERAAVVFCESFDKAHRRARKNSSVGLPDDYRRYAAHCRKILKHIKTVDKPTHELELADDALQDRLGDIQARISELASMTTSNRSGRWGKGPHVSVFDRANTLSVSSSMTTTDGSSSWDDSGAEDHGQQTKLSPLDKNPHHYHIPYPPYSTMPAPDPVEPRGNINTAPRSTAAHQQDLQSGRPYDRAGAWREPRPNSKPRMSISREFVHGQFSPSASTPPPGTGNGSYFGAEEHLHLIKQQNIQVGGMGPQAEQGYLDDLIQTTGRGSSSQATSLAHLRSQDRLDDNPFFEGSSTVGPPSIPSMDVGNADWRPKSQEGCSSTGPGPSHSDSLLESDIGQWVPSGLPVVVHSTSNLGPPSNTLRSRRRAAEAGEAFSHSLPISQTSTLRSPSLRLSQDEHTSISLSREPTSYSDRATASIQRDTTSRTQPRRASPTAARQPSPRLSGPEILRQRQRHAKSDQGSPRTGAASLAAGSATDEGVEMVRSGSGGIQFNGRIVAFGHSPPSAKTFGAGLSGYPEEISESALEDGEAGSLTRSFGLGIAKDPRGWYS